MYSGAMDCVKKTIAKEGPKGLYKGKKKVRFWSRDSYFVVLKSIKSRSGFGKRSYNNKIKVLN